MAEICEACFDPEGYRQVLGVIARRLQEKDERWRMAYKALLLLEYLIKHGPEKVWRDVQQSGSVLQRLQRFEYVDDNQRDHGVNVRHRAQEIQELVANEERVREERRKAAENKAKYSGYSANQMRTAASSGSSVGRSDASRVTGFGSGRSGSANVSRGGGYSGSQRTTRPSSSTHMTPSNAPREPQAHVGGDLAIDGHGMPALDPVSATQARIASMKISSKELHYDDPVEDKPAKKKLSDIRANPKIAASLGLKVAAPTEKTASTGQTNKAPALDDAAKTKTDVMAAVMTDGGTTSDDILCGLDTVGAPESNEAWDPFGEAAGQGMISQTSEVFHDDPFAAVGGPLDVPPSLAPTGITKPAAQSTPLDPFAVSQSSDPSAVQRSNMPEKRAEKSKADPFADLLL